MLLVCLLALGTGAPWLPALVQNGSCIVMDKDAGRYTQFAPPIAAWNSEGATPGVRVAVCADWTCASSSPGNPITLDINESDPRYIKWERLVQTFVFVGDESAHSRSLLCARCQHENCAGGDVQHVTTLDKAAYIGIFGTATVGDQLYVVYPANPLDGAGCELRYTSGQGSPTVLARAAEPFSVPDDSSLPVTGFATVDLVMVGSDGGKPFVVFWDCGARALRGLLCSDLSCARVQKRMIIAQASPPASPGAWVRALAWNSTTVLVAFFDLGVGSLSAATCSLEDGEFTCSTPHVLDENVHGSGTGPRGAFSDYGGGGFPEAHMVRGPRGQRGHTRVAMLLYFSEARAGTDGGGDGPGQLRAAVCPDALCLHPWTGTVVEGGVGFGRDVSFAELDDGFGVTLLDYNATGEHKLARFVRLAWK